MTGCRSWMPRRRADVAARCAGARGVAIIAQRIGEVLRSGEVAFQDFYRDDFDRAIYLALLVPILDQHDGDRPLGVLVLRIDPERYLYPFISHGRRPAGRPRPCSSAGMGTTLCS